MRNDLGRGSIHRDVGKAKRFIGPYNLASGFRMVDPAFENRGNRHATLAQAMAAAAEGDTILLAPGVYNEALTVFSQKRLTLKGSGMPSYDTATGKLAGGTIIKGRITMDKKYGATITDLGVDVSDLTVDGITSGGADTLTKLNYTLRNVAVNGAGYATQQHAILLDSGSHHHLSNIRLYNCYHGVALRCSYVDVDDLQTWSCYTTVIVKGDTGTGDACYVNISNVVIDGDSASQYTRGGAIVVQNVHASTITKRVNISNVVSHNGFQGVVVIGASAGTCSHVVVSNCQAYGCGYDNTIIDYSVSDASEVSFTNCSSDSAAGTSFATSGTVAGISAVGCHSNSPGLAAYSGHWDRLELNGLAITATRLVDNLYPDSGAKAMAGGAGLMGRGTLAQNGTDDLVYLTWGGASNAYSMLGGEVTLVCAHQGVTTIQVYRFSVARKGTSTLVGAVVEIGAVLKSETGTPPTFTISVDVATANIAKIKAAASGGSAASSYAYYLQVLTDAASHGLWTVENKAA